MAMQAEVRQPESTSLLDSLSRVLGKSRTLEDGICALQHRLLDTESPTAKSDTEQMQPSEAFVSKAHCLLKMLDLSLTGIDNALANITRDF